MSQDYRLPIERRICDGCIRSFLEHEDCKRCETDHQAWEEQMRVKTLPVEYRGIRLGDVYSQTVRLIL